MDFTDMKAITVLPKGQFDIGDMPRFGLSQFADRFPAQTQCPQLQVSGDMRQEITIGPELSELPQTQVVADFHCVTTWSSLNLKWEGVLFKDVFEHFVQPLGMPDKQARFVILRGQDGDKTSLPLDDLLKSNVILATRLNDEPLSMAHGAPLRLVAPDHYGYKSIKYLNRMSLHVENPGYRPSGFRFMEHPRARVSFEERGQFFPGWFLRYSYRPLIKPTAKLFANAAELHSGKNR
ncbi:molybdopterin-dependent oxidoreductase [Pseudophaeobacter sp. EL27]|uniref:molybdopterin-dependent oxidoreductase n=1 Tax=Pseudophaeobacter sp. EL27 TaxID=2107580 RepID=UPI000EFAFD43|nr:molybdopterin-dependent oxidoreductase [Pseudophaeobacter sp. EL27]